MALSPTATHPNPHHRKIELQSPLDLTYLQTNLSASAQQKLDLHFPPTAYHTQRSAPPAEVISLDGPSNDSSEDASRSQAHTSRPEVQTEMEEDPLRARVRQLVDDFLARTWQGASHSISINGLDAKSLPAGTPSGGVGEEGGGEREGADFTYQAFDSRLQQKVASLYGELESLTAQVSKLRREAPKRGAEMYVQQMREGIERDEKAWSDEVERLRRGVEKEKGLELDDLREGWHEDVKGMYERGVDELARLAGLAGKTGEGQQGRGGSLTETVGKVQRARTVAMEFE